MSPTPTLPPTSMTPRPLSPSSERRRLKTETSASGGWAMRLQAMIEGKGAQRGETPHPQRPAPSR